MRGCAAGDGLGPQTALGNVGPDLAERWGKRFWQSCQGKAESGAWETPSPDSRFYCSSDYGHDLVDEALQAYPDKTGDMRLFEELPLAVTSQILREAQRLKCPGSRKIDQPAATDGWIES